MTKIQDDIQSQIAENLDRRRLEITNLRRIVLNHVGKPLESTVVRMCVPMIYAHWEGYVKEVCQLYLEHIEGSVTAARQLQPAILGYLWTPMLKPITGGLSFDRRKVVAECALRETRRPIKFGDAEKAINTRSNLNFSVLEGIANDLCLDISSLTQRRRHLDTIVHIRNIIAHGANPQTLRHSDFEEHAEAVMGLMEEFERVVVDSIQNARFCQRRPKPKATRHGGRAKSRK
jgi:hypothetical protein